MAVIADDLRPALIRGIDNDRSQYANDQLCQVCPNSPERL